jgi:putative membrane protein
MIPVSMIAGIVIATSSEVIYTYYLTVPRIWGFTALEDQAIGGVLMWVSGSEMVVWSVLFLLAGFSQQEEHKHVLPVSDWDNEEKMIAPGLEHRVTQNKWRKLATSKTRPSDVA